jgi:hypothetical protein
MLIRGCIMEHPTKMDDDWGTPILENLHITVVNGY